MVTRSEHIKQAVIDFIEAYDSHRPHKEQLDLLRSLVDPKNYHKQRTDLAMENLLWIKHPGGSCAVTPRTRVIVKRRDGEVKQGCSHYFRWNWRFVPPKPADILEYAVLKDRP